MRTFDQKLADRAGRVQQIGEVRQRSDIQEDINVSQTEVSVEQGNTVSPPGELDAQVERQIGLTDSPLPAGNNDNLPPLRPP